MESEQTEGFQLIENSWHKNPILNLDKMMIAQYEIILYRWDFGFGQMVALALIVVQTKFLKIVEKKRKLKLSFLVYPIQYKGQEE